MNTEPGKAEIRLGPLADVLTEREVVAAISDRGRASVRHLVEVDPVLVKESAMEKLRLEGQLFTAPQRVLGQESDGSVLVVIEVLQRIGQFFVRRFERLARDGAGEVAHIGRSKLHIRRSGFGSRHTREDSGRRDSHRSAKNLPTIQGMPSFGRNRKETVWV